MPIIAAVTKPWWFAEITSTIFNSFKALLIIEVLATTAIKRRAPGFIIIFIINFIRQAVNATKLFNGVIIIVIIISFIVIAWLAITIKRPVTMPFIKTFNLNGTYPPNGLAKMKTTSTVCCCHLTGNSINTFSQTGHWWCNYFIDHGFTVDSYYYHHHPRHLRTS